MQLLNIKYSIISIYNSEQKIKLFRSFSSERLFDGTVLEICCEEINNYKLVAIVARITIGQWAHPGNER